MQPSLRAIHTTIVQPLLALLEFTEQNTFHADRERVERAVQLYNSHNLLIGLVCNLPAPTLVWDPATCTDAETQAVLRHIYSCVHVLELHMERQQQQRQGSDDAHVKMGSSKQ